jgi:predicted HicB family RNase H-like nuclease
MSIKVTNGSTNPTEPDEPAGFDLAEFDFGLDDDPCDGFDTLLVGGNKAFLARTDQNDPDIEVYEAKEVTVIEAMQWYLKAQQQLSQTEGASSSGSPTGLIKLAIDRLSQPGSNVPMTILLKQDTAARLQKAAKAAGKSENAIIEEALTRAVQ